MKKANILNYPVDSDALIERAIRCLEDRLIKNTGQILSSSHDVKNYLKLQIAKEKNEVFAVLFLNSRHQLLAFEKLFFGTVNQAVVYPRRVVQKVIDHNAAAVIVAHNHPSGNSKPSREDMEITKQLYSILQIIDVKLIDHVIITSQDAYSFAEFNLMPS